MSLHAINATFVAYILISFATLLLEIPTVRLIEGSICNRYYSFADNATYIAVEQVDESACKVPQVQSLLAKLVGWKMSFDAIPGILLQFFNQNSYNLPQTSFANKKVRSLDGCLLRITG